MATHPEHTARHVAQRTSKVVAGALAATLAASGTPLAPALAATNAQKAQEMQAAGTDGELSGDAAADAGKAADAGLAASAAADEAEGAQAAGRDIADEWSAGALTLRTAGAYTLSRDVTAAGTLSIEAAQGETITLDMQGHSVECAAGVEAAIELGASKGKVVVTDSARAGALASGTGTPDEDGEGARARICLRSGFAHSALAGISFDEAGAADAGNAADGADAQGARGGQDAPDVEISHVAVEVSAADEAEGADGAQDEGAASGQAHDGSTQEHDAGVYGVRIKAAGEGAQGENDDARMPAFTISDCSIDAAATPKAQSGEGGATDDAGTAGDEKQPKACALDVQGARLTLDGETALRAHGADGSVQLHLHEARPITLGKDLALADALYLRADGADAGAVLAQRDDGTEIEAALADKIASADAAWKAVLSEDRTALVWQPADDAAGSADASGAEKGNTPADGTGHGRTADTAPGAAGAGARLPTLPSSGTGGAGSATAGGEAKASPLGSITTQELLAAAEQGESLNGLLDAWAANPDNGSDFTIDKGGVYRLDADLATSCRIVVKAPGQNVVFKLDGHALSIDTQSIGYGIDVQSAARVTIDGSGGAGSAIRFSSSPLLAAVRSAAGALVANDVEIEASSRQTRLANLSGACIDVESGTLEATRVKATVDQSNQSVVSDTSGESFHGAPAAFLLAAGAGAATLSDCTAATTGSPCVAPGSSPNAEIGYVYALRAQTNAQVTLRGGSWSAQVANGAAIAASAKNLLVAGSEASFAACGATRAICLESTAAGGVKVDAKLSFSFDGQATPALAAGFSSGAGAGFTFTGNADFSQTGALVEDSAGGQNLPDACIAQVDGGDAGALAAKLSNALGETAACSVGANGDAIVFAFEQTRAPAEVRASGGQTTRHATLARAIEAMQDGDTLVLLADADKIAFSKAGDASASFTIDMNGKTARALVHSSACALSVVSTGGRGRIEAASKTSAAVSLSTNAALSLSGIDVVNHQAASSACGIEATAAGRLELDDVDVEVSAQTGMARALRLAGTQGALVAENSALAAFTACPGVTVRGVQAAARTSCDLSATSIDVQGSSGSAIGIESNGAVRFAGADGAHPASLRVRTSQAAASAACIDLTQASAKAIVKDAALELDAPGADGAAATLMAGAATARVESTWVLDGYVDLSGDAAVHVSHRTTPLRIGPSFRSARPVAVASTQLSAKAFAQAASEKDLSLAGDGADDAAFSIEPAAASFTPTGDYGGWAARAEQDESGAPSRLRWARAPLAQLVHGAQSTGYETLSEAFAAAQDGDTVQLAADAAVNERTACDKQVSFDLHGHVAQLSVVGTAGGDGALAYTGAGTFTICDSAASAGQEAGALEIEVGAQPETSNSAQAGAYRGIAVTGGGMLALDGAAVHVRYTGTTQATSAPTPTVQGVALVDGSLSMTGASALRVEAARADAGFGANTATGVYVRSADSASRVEVGKDARVEVDNSAAPSTIGSFQVIGPEQSNSSTQPAYVVQIFPDTASDFYREICEKFTEQARFDDAAEDGSYNSEIYYCAPLTLDDGTCIWAYSDPVDTAARGHLASIVPTRFFMQCGQETPTCAYGIQSGDAFAGTVEVEGALETSCTHGDAYALDAKGASTWEAGAGTLQEAHGSEEHLLAGSRMDMRDYFDFGSRYNDPVYLPTTGSPQAVRVRTCTGAAARVDAKAKVAIGGVVQPESAEESVDAKDDGIYGFGDEKRVQTWGSREVAVAFDNVRDENGAASRIEAATTVPFLSTLADAGVSLPAPADYTLDDGTVMRFIGWCAANNSDNYVYTPDALADAVALDGTVSGAKNGSVVFSAHYVPVAPGAHLVSFKVDTTVLAYAVADGAAPSYAGVAANARAATPAKVDTETGCYYSFAGWAGEDGRTWWTLPAATADAVYTASFTTRQSLVSLTFTYRDADGVERSASERVEFDTDVNARAAKLVQAGNAVKTPETVYTFAGFGPRKTDVEAYYADGALPSMRSDSFWRYSNVYYAKYDSAPRTVDVRFMDGDAEYAKTDAPVATSALFNDVLAACGKGNPQDAGEGRSFLGWSKTKGATAPDIEKVNSAKLSTLVDGESDTLVLYAVYGKAQPASVEFYDAEAFPDKMSEDKLLATLSVEQGKSIDDALAAEKKSAPVPTRGGKYFAGWVDASGNAVSFSDAVKSNMKLFATYKDVDVELRDDAAANFEIDVSGLLVGAKGIDEAEKVVVSVERVSAADRALSRLAAGNLGYSPMLNAGLKNSIYSLRLYYVKDGTAYDMEGGFGKIAVKAKVPKSFQSSKTRAFWVGSDGMAYTKVSQNSAQIAFDVRYLGYVEPGYGNLVIGIAANSSGQKQLDPSAPGGGTQDADDTGGGAQDGAGADAGDDEEKADLAPAAAVLGTAGQLAAALPALAGTAAQALADGALSQALAAGTEGVQAAAGLAADALGADAARAAASDDIQSQVEVGQDGNVAGLAVVGAAFAALLARLGAFLFGRRKKDDEDGGEAPMPLEETVRF